MKQEQQKVSQNDACIRFPTLIGAVGIERRTCVKVGIVSVNFKVDLDKIVDKKLSVAIEVPGLADPVKTFPLSEAGNPTINVRLLLEDA